MRHQVSGRQLGRSKDQRRALFRSIVGEFIVHGKVQTTLAKAKAVKPLIDKLVTKAKRADVHARRELVANLPKGAALLLIDTVAPRFKDRVNGFSRIIRLAKRKGDDAEMVLLEWVEQIQTSEVGGQKSEKKPATTEAQKKSETQRKPRRKRSRKIV